MKAAEDTVGAFLSPHETSTILDSIADGVFTVDRDWRVTYFNHAAEEITGISRKEALGRPCCEVFRADICENNCALKETINNGMPIVDRAITIIKNDGKRVPISISTALLKEASGEVIGGVEGSDREPDGDDSHESELAHHEPTRRTSKEKRATAIPITATPAK